jgi:hypothetical protein
LALGGREGWGRMNAVEVHRYVCSAFDEYERRRFAGVGPQNWEVLRADLLVWARGIDPEVAFAGLLSILESERRYAYQYIAGELLDKADILCPLPLEELMRRVLPLWDLSAGTVPRYAARMFGRDAVLTLMRGLKARGDTWPGRGVLDGVRYHLGEHPADD